MELYARTELDEYVNPPQFSTSRRFILVKWGWFAFSFILTPEEYPTIEKLQEAKLVVDALYELDQ